MRAKYLESGERRLVANEPEEISDLHRKQSSRGGERRCWTFATAISIAREWAEFVSRRLAACGPCPSASATGVLLVVVPDGATASLLRYQIPDPCWTAIEERFGSWSRDRGEGSPSSRSGIAGNPKGIKGFAASRPYTYMQCHQPTRIPGVQGSSEGAS